MGFDMDDLLTDTRIAYRHLKKSYPDPLLVSKLEEPKKSNFYSLRYRNEGNAKYKEGRDYEALTLYTMSIASATEDSEELALAYANRSAVLFRLCKFVSCVLDINRALKGKYPSDLRKKLQTRKRKCLTELKSEGSEIRGDETELIIDAINNDFSKWRADFKNSLLPNTKSKIKLACNEKWGRHMVAAKNIEPGEILSSEEFLSAFLNHDHLFNNCSYCFVKCETLIPCPSCSKAMYCSDHCRTLAFNSYHRTECKIWPLYVDEKLPYFDIIAVRTFLVGTEQGARLKNLMENLDIQNIFEEKVNPVNKAYRNDYLSILRLRWTFDEPPKEFILLAVKITIVLQHLSFFENVSNEGGFAHQADCPSEIELFTTLIMINHLSSMKFYNYGIGEVTANQKDAAPFSCNEYVIGFGILSLHNMINHSCNPNIGTFVRRREHTFFSLRPIKQGQQIFVSYCTSFVTNHLEERRRKLSLFGFTCHCKACKNVWPSMYESAPFLYENPEFLTRNKNVIKDIMMMMPIMRKIFDQPYTIESLRNAIQYRKMIHNNVREPSLLIIMCEGLIMNFMKRSYGNFYIEDKREMKNGNDINDLNELNFLTNLVLANMFTI